MKDFFWIIKHRFRLWISKPIQVLFLLGIPFLSIFLYLFAYNDAGTANSLRIGLLDQDDSAYSKVFTEYLGHRVTVVSLDTEEEVSSSLANQSMSGVITLDKGFGETIEEQASEHIQVQSIQGEEVSQQLLQLIEQSLGNSIQVRRIYGETFTKADHEQLSENRIETEYKTNNQKDASKMLTVQIVGFLMMMLLYQAGNFGSKNLQQERSDRIFYRLMSTPLSKTAYFSGTATFAMFAMIFEILLTTAALTWIFNIDTGVSAFELITILFFFSLVAVMWSIAIGVSARNRGVASALEAILFTVTSLVSGGFIPLAIMPDFMQQIAKVTPQYWAIDALAKLQNNQGFSSIGLNIVLLLGFVLLFFGISAYGFSKNKQLNVFQ